jgi:predicted nucleotidyltransferase component of viral defense system
VNKIARISARDRRDLFSEAAAKLGMRPTIIEKDFWVCLVLKMLFMESPFKESLVFKGGTSLSKVYKLIDRFSEDIDLVLDWKLIGFGQGLKDPMQNFQSTTRQTKFNREVNHVAATFIRESLCPQVNEQVERAGVGLSATVDDADPQIVNIRYPAAFKETYIRPEVRLEIGPLASWVPSAAHIIRPYAFDVFPGIFEDPACPVIAITAERTFWEKATILHQEAHRPSLIPIRHSRHYYDLYKLALSPIKEQAFAQRDLLPAVVQFKKRFYPSAWARYDRAKPGTFRLLPSGDGQIANLERDYDAMQMMLFGEPPSFSMIIEVLGDLEGQINSSSKDSVYQNARV